MPANQSSARPMAVPESRVSRMARLGGLATSIMGSVAYNGARELARGKQPGLRDLVLKPSNLHRVTDELARMRGAAMKIGQIISMDTGEVLRPELADILARLRADAHFMPPRQLKERLNENWHKNWLRDFKSFDVRPIAAASIGQVHRALLHDGRSLAVKVQYPGVARSIDSDVNNVGALLRMSGLLPKGFDVAPYLEEARQQLHEETDYLREGHHLHRFHTLLSGNDDFEVPGFQQDWSTQAVLAMSFAEGYPIEGLADAPQEQRNQIAARLIDLTLKELFVFGVFQSDPNFANYLYDCSVDRIVLLDFGATRELEPRLVDQYRRLLNAGLQSDRDALVGIAEEIGFLSPEMPIDHHHRIVGMMEMVFAALHDAPIFDFADTTLSRHMQAEGLALAESGFIPPPVPMDVLYLQRKFGGLFLLASRLRAKVPLFELVAPYLDDNGDNQSPKVKAAR